MTLFLETMHAEMKALPVLLSSVRSLFDVGRVTANSAYSAVSGAHAWGGERLQSQKIQSGVGRMAIEDIYKSSSETLSVREQL